MRVEGVGHGAVISMSIAPASAATSAIAAGKLTGPENRSSGP